MQHYDLLTGSLPREYDKIKTNKKISYVNLPCAFDIETTSTNFAEQKVAHMYIWMIGIGHNNGVFYGRTWDEFADCIEKLQTHFKTDPENRLVIYVHNLGYEFQFMRKHFTWGEVFSISDRKPLKALTVEGIEFRCSYLLSGFSLANTAKNLTKHKVKKMTGDLDYALERHHLTPLTDEEMGYCENDIVVVTAYIDEQIDLYGDITKIPTTNTGRVRNHVRNECYYDNTNHRKSSKSKYVKYRKIMKDLTIDPDTYIMLKRAFMGGFTHANANHSGKLLENVSSIDFTSSYPAVMVSEKFPMSRFKQFTPDDLEHFNIMCGAYAVIANMRFVNLRPKISQENYISESKCFDVKGAVINNGRIVSADILCTTLTEIDLDIMTQCYEWDKLSVSNCRYAHKAYLPKPIIKSILEMYQGKTELKDVEGAEVEYLLSKGMLNSIYGMCVTDVVKDQVTYSDEWGVEPANIYEEIENYNEGKNRFLYYPWGIWVTAYARRNLWTGILAVGDDYVYSDTDSLKVLNYEKYSAYVRWYDTQVMRKMLVMCKEYKFSPDLLKPKTKEGNEKPLGVWDFEGTYTRFKTLGAKRYLIEKNDKLQITVAGLSKQNGLAYMLEQAGGDNTKVFQMFDDALYIPAEKTGKMTHTYIDEETEYLSTDYLGNSCKVVTKSGVHLEPCDFTLSISRGYIQFMNQLKAGYIFKGVKYK